MRHHVRPQEACVIAGKASLVFGQAHANQRGGRHVNTPNRLAAGENEVVVLGAPSRLCTAGTFAREADPLPNKKGPGRDDFYREENASPPGKLRRCQATQLTKKRIWRPSSCTTG